jgi:hypothetical protein
VNGPKSSNPRQNTAECGGGDTPYIRANTVFLELLYERYTCLQIAVSLNSKVYEIYNIICSHSLDGNV